MECPPIELEAGWDRIAKGIEKIIKIVEQELDPSSKAQDSMEIYTTIYQMCTQIPPHEYPEQLYEKYKQTLEEYITHRVLPALRKEHGELVLRELVKRWKRHCKLYRELYRSFHYLDRYFFGRKSIPSISEVGPACFLNLVFQELHGNVKDAVLALILAERKGEQIDRALLKDVLGVYVEAGMDSYQNFLEEHLLAATAAYYSDIVSSWILEDSCPKYLLKAKECVKKEKKIAHHLHPVSERKLIEKVVKKLLSEKAIELLDRNNSGLGALVVGNKVEDVSRIYRLYKEVRKGLIPVQKMFKQSIIAEGFPLIELAIHGGLDQVIFRKLIELYDKYNSYVLDCFGNDIGMNMACVDAFRDLMSDDDFTEQLAIFCDVILKSGDEKLRDETIEYVIYKSKDLFVEYHRQTLCRRLCSRANVNFDLESSFFAKMKSVLGGRSCARIEAMLDDVTHASETAHHFEEYVNKTRILILGSV